MITIQPENYPALLEEKVAFIRNLFDQYPADEINVFDSPVRHFRMRTEFRIWHDEAGLHYIMFDKSNQGEKVFITEFPQACENISSLMQPLLLEIQKFSSLADKLFQIDFLSTLNNETLVTLIYHKKLDAEWQQFAVKLEEKFNIFIVGRARKQKITVSQDYVIEKLKINNVTFQYQQNENSFTQPNAIVCQKMLSWAQNKCTNSTDDLLELYCGNGNFTLPLSIHFQKVLANEISKSSVNCAQNNINTNNLTNINILRMSSEEISQALSGVRKFRRMADIDINNYRFSTVFVDPPRAGLDEKTLEFISQFQKIIYISCNPLTLKENLQKLNQFTIKHLALFDQFPYTNHIECGMVLEK